MELKFLGAAGTVTGSKALITHRGKRILVDSGLYQGIKEYRRLNWQPLPIPADQLDAVVLTHAHIDHSGYLPALVRRGFSGPIYCSEGTRDLCRVLLPDAGYLQEEDARHAALHGYSKHVPPKPLYTEADAWRTLKQFQVLEEKKEFKLPGGLSLRLRPVGHILGACSVELFDGHHMLCFSGDLGRKDDPLLYPPESLPRADYLVLESTYGDRLHPDDDVHAHLAEIINRTTHRGGVVLLPAFAVGRAQLVLHLIAELKASGAIADIPVFLNSPMAIRATEIFCRSHEQHRLSAEACAAIDANTHYVRTTEESIALNNKVFPCLIISASGMASGGRVLHHLKTLAPNHRNSIVFLGFQAPGTRGETIINGAARVKMHGELVPIRAEVHHIDSLSAHADYAGILEWLAKIPVPPKKLFLNHGEEGAAQALKARIEERFGWDVEVAARGQEVKIGKG